MGRTGSKQLLGRQAGSNMLTKGDVGSRARRPWEGGFTLIELVVTLALLGILFMVAMPSLTEWIRNSQVRSVAEAVQNGLRVAQAEAVRRNQDVVMSLTNDANPTLNPTAVAGGRNWSIQTVAKTYINNNVAEFIRAGAFADVASGVVVTTVVTGTSTPVLAVCFNANGRLLGPTPSSPTENCVANPVTFQISQTGSDRPLNVAVAVGGQVRMCDPNRPALSAASPDGCPP